jgi:hypothetical protein
MKTKNKQLTIHNRQTGQALRQSSGQAIQQSSGQAMLILVLVLGATMLGVSTIAGYISLQKIRTSTDIIDSTKAIFAADSGIEWCFYNKYSPNGTSTFVCDGSFDVGSGANVTVSQQPGLIKAVGHAGRSYRAFGLFLDELNP